MIIRYDKSNEQRKVLLQLSDCYPTDTTEHLIIPSGSAKRNRWLSITDGLAFVERNTHL